MLIMTLGTLVFGKKGGNEVVASAGNSEVGIEGLDENNALDLEDSAH
jgi:hypothetical protein